MLIKSKKSWELPESQATPEHLFMNRRGLLGMGAAVIGSSALPAFAAGEDPSAALYPAKRNEAYTLDRPLTTEAANGSYNNFYEYSTDKKLSADKLITRPWSVKIDGLVEKPQEFAIDDLIKAMPLEERLYRHRCVETWSMTIPWTGFSLKSLVEKAKPTSAAKYVRFETFNNPKMAPGQKMPFYPWPYVEAVTMDEAMNELGFMATGAYGHPLAKVHGAPLRLALPWKYGFKSIKSIVKISFVAERPVGLWEALQASEYGFWANVNPDVAHPRWSQAMETVIGTNERRPTLLYNGYGEQVASLYKGMEKENLFR
eukprot:gene7364-7430_t